MAFKKIILVGLLSILTSLAQANQKPSSDYYLQLNLGYAHGLKPKGDFAQGNMGDTGLYGLELGYRINKNFRTSLSLDYRPNFKNSYSTSTNEPTPHLGVIQKDATAIESYHTKVKSLVAMLNVYYDITQVSNFTPYLTLGVGVASNKTSSSMNATHALLGYNKTTDYIKATNNSFAYKVGLGSRYSVNNSVELDLRYQYVDLGRFKTGASVSCNGNYINEAAKNGKLKAHEFILGLVYKF